MDILRQHEIFEIEVLDKLKNKRVLEPLVFCGGTMLRLCYELNRYSSDLDFWFVKKVNTKTFSVKVKRVLAESYELTDACDKFNTLLFEVRSSSAPKRLKIEIRKGVKNIDWQDTIAYSKYTATQVLLRALTLKQAMKNKLEAGLDRKDIRDFFDMEFLLRQGLALRARPGELSELKKIAEDFKEKDFKVILGSVLEEKTRKYYISNKFDYLMRKISAQETMR